mmetsp:Transcript_21180/g.51712  ORF Transcript_21180/g.51712 Transcript_21180/m.51712 type:complete len:93 (+) Transcript_21180:441-719(+)
MQTQRHRLPSPAATNESPSIERMSTADRDKLSAGQSPWWWYWKRERNQRRRRRDEVGRGRDATSLARLRLLRGQTYGGPCVAHERERRSVTD